MNRLALALLLVLPLGGNLLAGTDLAKELKRFDPTLLDKKSEKAVRKEAEERAVGRYGKIEGRSHVPELYAEVSTRTKRELLAAATSRHLAALDAYKADTPAATKALCTLYSLIEEAQRGVDKRRAEVDAKFRKLITGDPFSTKWQYKAGSVAEAKGLEVDRILLREYGYHLLELRTRCVALLAEKNAEGSLRYLATNALQQGKDPHLRAKVAEVLSRRKDADPQVFLAAAAKEKDGGVRAALVFTLGRLDDRAREAVSGITPFVADPDERVRVAAARTLARLHVPEAVGPLVAQMAHETGRPLADFAWALESLTGERFGADPAAWTQWWAGNKTTVMNDGLPPPGGGEGERALRWKGEGGFYYGIPQVSRRIIYVIDTSHSMYFGTEDKNRLERCVTEIKRALDQLPSSSTFTLIAYNTEVRCWREGMVPASKANKAAAKAFLDELRPAQTTNIYDALKKAFDIAGEGATKKGAKVNADTIYLLSDGAPTLPDASPDDPERVLLAARYWNALGRVTIHTIGIGNDVKFSFLKSLAAQHNGRFIHRDW